MLARFAIRIFGGRKIKWDDGFVLISCIFLIASFVCVHKLLNTFYLVEAMNQKIAIPFREDVPAILEVPKWAFMFSVFTWTSLYFVKFAFMYFFYPLTLGLSIRIMRFYWVTVGFLVVCWIYAVVNFAVICPHFGADAGQLALYPFRDQSTNFVQPNVAIITGNMQEASRVTLSSAPSISYAMSSVRRVARKLQ